MNRDRGCARPAPVGKSALVTAMVLAVVGFSTFALGQKDTGAIAGTVRDPGGAVLSGAKISVVDANCFF
jgi:hypothetical protein